MGRGEIKINKKEFKNRAYSYKTFKLNKSKYELLEAYAIEARNFRNIVSEEIYNNYRQNIFYREINKNKLVTELKYLNKCTKISSADCQQAIRDVYIKYETNLDILIKKYCKINTNDKPIKLLFNYMVRYYKDEEHFEKMLEDQFIDIFNKINVKNPEEKDLENYNFRLKLLNEYVSLKRKNFFKGQTNLNFISFVRYTQDFIIKKINKVTYKSLTFNHMNV